MTFIPAYAPPENLPAPITSGSGIQSFTDVWGDVWVAANGVNGGMWRRARDVLHAYWYRTAAINTPTASTIFLYDTVGGFVGSQDSYSLYNSSTGTFTPPIPGWWQIYHQIGGVATASGQWLQAVLRNTTSAAMAGAVAQSSSATLISPTCSWRGFLPVGYGVMTYVQASAALAVNCTAYWTYLHIDYLGTG